MQGELKTASAIAEEAKSTWEKLRKERDYHKGHQNRVNDEKVTITTNIKKIKTMHEEYEEKIEEVKKKLLNTTKEKALLKLEKDKLQKKAADIQARIKADEDMVQQKIEAAHRKQRQALDQQAMDQSQIAGESTLGKGTNKNTPFPEDARPNPFLAQTYEALPGRMSG